MPAELEELVKEQAPMLMRGAEINKVSFSLLTNGHAPAHFAFDRRFGFSHRHFGLRQPRLRTGGDG